MAVKMIVSDLDRTLLGSDGKVSQRTAEAIEACRKCGTKVVLATARPKSSVEPILNSVKVDSVVYNNGAMVMFDEQICCEQTISQDNLSFVLNNLCGDNLHIAVDMETGFYANFDKSVFGGIDKIKSDFKDLPNIPADKILVWLNDTETTEQIKNSLPNDLYMNVVDDGNLGLIMNKNATKLKGIEAVAERYGFSLEEVVAFGDDTNDIEMLKMCGIGVAMDNAIREVKDNADLITSSNDKNGVAQWIENNILQQAHFDYMSLYNQSPLEKWKTEYDTMIECNLALYNRSKYTRTHPNGSIKGFINHVKKDYGKDRVDMIVAENVRYLSSEYSFERETHNWVKSVAQFKLPKELGDIEVSFDEMKFQPYRVACQMAKELATEAGFYKTAECEIAEDKSFEMD